MITLYYISDGEDVAYASIEYPSNNKIKKTAKLFDIPSSEIDVLKISSVGLFTKGNINRDISTQIVDILDENEINSVCVDYYKIITLETYRRAIDREIVVFDDTTILNRVKPEIMIWSMIHLKLNGGNYAAYKRGMWEYHNVNFDRWKDIFDTLDGPYQMVWIKFGEDLDDTINQFGSWLTFQDNVDRIIMAYREKGDIPTYKEYRS